MENMHGKPTASKPNSDTITLVKPFPEAHNKAMKHYVYPDLENRLSYFTY